MTTEKVTRQEMAEALRKESERTEKAMADLQSGTVGSTEVLPRPVTHTTLMCHSLRPTKPHFSPLRAQPCSSGATMNISVAPIAQESLRTPWHV